MLNKPGKMTHRLPALVVPDEMYSRLWDISESEGLTLSEVVRQGLAFFLHQYDSSTITPASSTSDSEDQSP